MWGWSCSMNSISEASGASWSCVLHRESDSYGKSSVLRRLVALNNLEWKQSYRRPGPGMRRQCGLKEDWRGKQRWQQTELQMAVEIHLLGLASSDHTRGSLLTDWACPSRNSGREWATLTQDFSLSSSISLQWRQIGSKITSKVDTQGHSQESDPW